MIKIYMIALISRQKTLDNSKLQILNEQPNINIFNLEYAIWTLEFLFPE